MNMSSGRNADTVRFGTSTSWLSLRSTATLAYVCLLPHVACFSRISMRFSRACLAESVAFSDSYLSSSTPTPVTAIVLDHVNLLMDCSEGLNIGNLMLYPLAPLRSRRI